MPRPISIFEDNQSVLKMIDNEKFSNRSKHIDTKFYFVKDFIKQHFISCFYCPTEDNIPDLFTKPLPKSRLDKLRNMTGLLYQ